jgi:hypothetical protein
LIEAVLIEAVLIEAVLIEAVVSGQAVGPWAAISPSGIRNLLADHKP